jgi:hypothetical protein
MPTQPKRCQTEEQQHGRGTKKKRKRKKLRKRERPGPETTESKCAPTTMVWNGFPVIRPSENTKKFIFLLLFHLSLLLSLYSLVLNSTLPPSIPFPSLPLRLSIVEGPVVVSAMMFWVSKMSIVTSI